MSATISIIIPCYNTALHVDKCIDSILSQTFIDFELILLNDGSTDNTLNILLEYQKKDERIKVYSHENRGVSYTRNRGVDLAKGEYLMFIDGDDYVSHDYLAKHIDAIENGIWVVSGMINVKNGVSVSSPYYKDLLSRFPKNTIDLANVIKLLKYHTLSSPCAKIYSKSIIIKHQIKFDEQVSYQEDLLFNLSYFKNIKSVRLIDFSGYYYIEYQMSSSSKFHKNFDHTETLFKELVFFIQNKDDEQIVEEFVFQTLLRKIVNVFNQTNHLNTTQYLDSINKTFRSEYIKYFNNYIFKSNVNIFLKYILKFKLTYFLLVYFKYLTK